MAARGESLTRLGDSSAVKTPRMGDSDSVRFSDDEFIEGMTFTQHLNQMKLFSAIAAAAVIGISMINASPSYSRETDWDKAYQHCVSTD